MKTQEAKLLQYTLLYDRSGKLVTERISTDIEQLKPYFSKEDYSLLKTLLRECTQKLDEVHNHLENNLDARVMT
jgi:hypothetical protein|tara:strand:- start:212 stop:433 length:222 start_codon:yes stop_codon:yes gene_type:complete